MYQGKHYQKNEHVEKRSRAKKPLAALVALVLIIGGIDLSIGSTACLSGILFALCMTKTGMHPLLAVVICVIAGALMGYINGLFITKLKLHPFIVTLAASNIGYGFVLPILMLPILTSFFN